IHVWQRMENAGGAQPPEFLSSHPSHGTRIQQLEAEMPKALEEYNRSPRAEGPAALWAAGISLLLITGLKARCVFNVACGRMSPPPPLSPLGRDGREAPVRAGRDAMKVRNRNMESHR